MGAWDTFAAITGGSAAALAGLLFVAVTLHAREIANSEKVAARALNGLIMFVMILIVSILIVIPGQGYRALGAELIALVVGTLFVMVGYTRGDVAPPITVFVLLPALAAGIILVIGLHAGLYVLVVSVLAAFAFGALTAWLLLLSFTE